MTRKSVSMAARLALIAGGLLASLGACDAPRGAERSAQTAARSALLEGAPITTARRAATLVVWAQMHLLEAGISFDVPTSWQRRPGAWRWSVRPGSGQEVALQWFDAAAVGDPAAVLPEGAEILSSAPLELRWGSATRYTLELPTAEGGAARFAQHLIVESQDGRVFDFSARAPGEAELRPLASLLRRMAGSVQVHKPSSTLAAPARRGECRAVTRVDPVSDPGRAVTATLAAALPRVFPAAARSAGPPELERVGPITRSGDWLLVHASFRRGPPAALFAVRHQAGSYRLERVLLVGGPSERLAAVRASLASQLPDAPRPLVVCADLRRWSL